MKLGVKIASLTLVFAPVLALAECAPDGYTVVYINGIHTQLTDAQNDLMHLQSKYVGLTGDRTVAFRYGYNATHLSGYGDEIKSAMQSYKTAASPLFEDFDLDTILNDIHSQVNTRKILIIGHSQGTLYANELYKYLITKGGVPKEDVAVYNIATPASYVAGGGQYITSANDKVINYVRTIDAEGNAPIALPANILIPLPNNEINDTWGGHHFQSDYLNGAGDRIVREIEEELSSLQATNADTGEGCFIAPGEPLSYRAKKAAFAIAEPISVAVSQKVSDDIAGATSFAHEVAQGIQNAIGAVVFTFSPRDDQETLGMFGVVKSLYGSSLSSSDVADLLDDGQSAAAASVNTDLGATDITPGTDPMPETLSRPTDSDEEISLPQQNLPPQSLESSDVRNDVRNDASDPTNEILPTPPAPPAASTSEQGSIGVPFAPMFSITPGFGGGGAAMALESHEDDSAFDEPDEPTEPEPADIALAIFSPAEGAYIATTSVAISGTAEASSTIFVTTDAGIATTTADADGTWILPLQLAEGSTTVAVSALTSAGSAATSTRTFTVDITPPAAPIVTIDACNESLAKDFCLVPMDSAELSWSGSADYFAVYNNDVLVGTTTATSTDAALADATSTYEIVAYDMAGNHASSSAIAATGVANPIVINEIGWGGTGANSPDNENQWIELKNQTPYEIDLSNILVHRPGGDIALSGSIPAAGFRVVARASTANLSNAVAIPFDPLAATGEQLLLVWRSDTILDATPAVEVCGGWCAGSALADVGRVQGISPVLSPISMERIDGNESGELATNWRSTDGYGPYGSGTEIWGTAGRANSLGLPESGVYCGDPSNLAVANAAFAPGDWKCTFLSRFIGSIGAYGSNRYVALYRGDVGSSTRMYTSLVSRSIAATRDVGTSAHDAAAGAQFFFAIWEQRTGGYAFGSSSDSNRFDRYFMTGASASTTDPHPPHDNYVVIPFTYEPAGE